jgi:hypothetical protein
MEMILRATQSRDNQLSIDDFPFDYCRLDKVPEKILNNLKSSMGTHLRPSHCALEFADWAQHISQASDLLYNINGR